MFIPIIWATINFETYYGGWPSVQYLVVFIVTIIIIIFLVARIFDKPDIDSLKLGTVKLYFSTTITVMLASFAAFGIAFSILWGNLYTFALEKGRMENYIDNLRGQGLVLLFLIIFASTSVLVTFLLPLLKRINNLENNNPEK